MAEFFKLNLKLSKRADSKGFHQVLLQVRDHNTRSHAFTKIMVDPNYFKEGVFNFGGGIDLEKLHKKRIRNLNENNHFEKAETLKKMCDYIENELHNTNITSTCLQRLVNRFWNPAKETKGRGSKKKSFYELSEIYISKKSFSSYHISNFRVMVRAICRYEEFIRMSQRMNKNYKFDIDTVTRDDIEAFREYLLREKELSDDYPSIFKELTSKYPANLMTNRNKIMGRGNNATIKLMKKLKAFFTWMYEEGITTNRPFDGIKIGSEKAGEPVYINIEERNAIAALSFTDEKLLEQLAKDEATPSEKAKEEEGIITVQELLMGEKRERLLRRAKRLEAQRDIFIFQCLVGCRVGDLMKFTWNNISNDNILSYVPHKTKNEGEHAVSARVPLVKDAIELINKYRGLDKDGRLFPFTSQQHYNKDIKEIFKLAGLTYTVKVFNALTEEFDYLPLNEVASSHMARKTFIGNLYKKVQDPNLIGQMSGHVDGSRAFKRYRKIEDETLRNTVNLLLE